MMMAYELEMTKGEYVFYTMEMLPEENVLNPEDVWASDDGLNTIAKQAFEAVFHVWHRFYRSLFCIHDHCYWSSVHLCRPTPRQPLDVPVSLFELHASEN